ncbi:hypothetical protein G7Y89_g634 [Cudoniella acicularis]|uniref:Mitochondrial ATPase complex subunit ATP10 n=1 Tax=Cudoniella acicularis TaxID=354080 RepID=A0A8H4RWS8_9HELO|nr:hypothetical protein G7Y89_g634 [Cudoniella acicularis]
MILARRQLLSASVKYDISGCIICQWRSFSTSYRRLDEKLSQPSPPSSSTPDTPKASPTSPLPPSPLENAPRATHQVASPYFREWSNMRFHKGKSFLAPPRLFKAERALYFPNLHGQTLIKDKKLRDTTTLLEGKVTVVSIFSTAWGENQAATFASEKNNPQLHHVVKSSGGLAQMVQINVEENFLKAMIIKLFMPNLRKKLEPDNWGRYFLIRKGLTEEIRDAIGLLNSKVGYTYLLDGECKIRWAGSGVCEEHEKDGLVSSVRKLVEDSKLKKRPTIAQSPTSNATKPTHNKKVIASAS